MIVEKAKNKMVLDHLVIQTLSKSQQTKEASIFDKSDLASILRFGAEGIFKEEAEEEKDIDDIDAILSRAPESGSNETRTLGRQLMDSFKV
jgi:hypothetical protein